MVLQALLPWRRLLLSQLNYGIGNTNQVGLINVSALNGDFSGNSFGW